MAAASFESRVHSLGQRARSMAIWCMTSTRPNRCRATRPANLFHNSFLTKSKLGSASFVWAVD